MKNILKKINTLWTTRRVEILLVGFTLLWGVFHAFFVYAFGLTRLSVDQNSHLNIARLLTDSLTPGISQLGFWPPALHVAISPFAAITPLYETGLAAAFVLVPLLAVGAYFLYRLLLEFYPYKITAVGAALLYITNPYILYYSVTPMTEALFITSLLAVAYFLLTWLKYEQFSSLIYLALAVAISGLTRFEGFFLIPIVALIIIIKLFRNRKSYHEIEAVSILFGLIAVLGLSFTAVYGIAYGNGPLEFMNGQWAASSQQESFFLPTAGDIGMSLVYMFEASKEMLGSFLVQVSLFSFLLLTVLLRGTNRFLPFLGVSAVLISPFVFDTFALVQGSAVLYLDHLAPFDGFFNERYGLYWYGFVLVLPMILLGLIMQRMNGALKYAREAFGGLVLVLVLGTNLLFLDKVAYTDTYAIQRSSAVSTLQTDQRELALVLSDTYDGGRILITRALQNYVTVEAGIPLKNYILESNDIYYEDALLDPWDHAKWVVMYNPDIQGVEQWRKDSERVSATWANSEEFEGKYNLIFENDSERLYELKDDALAILFSQNDHE